MFSISLTWLGPDYGIKFKEKLVKVFVEEPWIVAVEHSSIITAKYPKESRDFLVQATDRFEFEDDTCLSLGAQSQGVELSVDA
jgi:hypothetical protein